MYKKTRVSSERLKELLRAQSWEELGMNPGLF
jgi:hypothetical protein